MTNPQALEVLPEELAERKLFKAWAIDAGLMTAPDESGLCFKSDACRPAWAAWLMRSTLATQPAPQPEAQALPDSPTLRSTAQAVVDRWNSPNWASAAGRIHTGDLIAKLANALDASPAPAPTVKESLTVRGVPAPLTDEQAIRIGMAACEFRGFVATTNACLAIFRAAERYYARRGIGLDGGM